MKERKNILLLIGMIISVVPLIMHIIKLVSYASQMQLTQNILLLLSGNVALYVAVIFFAAMQMIRNKRNNSTWILPAVGIVLSGYCLITSIHSVARFIMVNCLNDTSAEQITKTLFSTMPFQIMTGVSFADILGHIFLLIGYIKSVPKRKE